MKTVDEMAKLSVRELVAGLSQVEDARRRARRAAVTGPASTHRRMPQRWRTVNG